MLKGRLQGPPQFALSRSRPHLILRQTRVRSAHLGGTGRRCRTRQWSEGRVTGGWRASCRHSGRFSAWGSGELARNPTELTWGARPLRDVQTSFPQSRVKGGGHSPQWRKTDHGQGGVRAGLEAGGPTNFSPPPQCVQKSRGFYCCSAASSACVSTMWCLLCASKILKGHSILFTYLLGKWWLSFKHKALTLTSFKVCASVPVTDSWINSNQLIHKQSKVTEKKAAWLTNNKRPRLSWATAPRRS